MPTDLPIEPEGEAPVEIHVDRMIVEGEATTYFSVSVNGGEFELMTPVQVRALGFNPQEIASRLSGS